MVDILAASTANAANVGGFFGSADNCTLENIHFRAARGGIQTEKGSAGGIAGDMDNGTSLKYCSYQVSDPNFTIRGAGYLSSGSGGLAGRAGIQAGTIEQCYAMGGRIESESCYVRGIAGVVYKGGIYNCYTLF